MIALCYLQKEDAMMHWGSYGWGVGLGWVYMILFWAVIITAVVYLVKFVENELDGEVRSDTPIDMIKSRYAKGAFGIISNVVGIVIMLLIVSRLAAGRV